MDRLQALKLIKRYNQGMATAEEKAMLENWYIHKSDMLVLEDDEIDFNQIDLELRTRTFKYAGLPEQLPLGKVIKRVKLWPRISAVASIIIIVAAGLFYLNYNQPRPGGLNAAKDNDIAAGSNKAILTLANGKQIVLTDAENGALANEDDALIKKTADGQLVYEGNAGNKSAALYNNVATPRGGQYSVMLSDGTKVVLNASSSLKYPTVFKGTDRTVELTGEGYFEVVHDKSRPFKVISEGQTVEVLGTHFNINSYTDEPNVKTTLIEGSVNVNGIVLKPNQQAILTASNQIVVKPFDGADAIAWKDGFFKFDNTDIRTLMRQISRWYDVEVVYEGNVKEEKFYGKIERSYTLSEVLMVLERGNVHFRIEGKKIIVMK